MRPLCIVQCGKIKIWDKNPKAGPCRARDVYTGRFAKKCREYAEKFYPELYYILSAKCGFLLPDDIVQGPYDVTFSNKKSNPISSEELLAQIKKKGLDQYQEVIMVGAKCYVKIVKAVFSNREVLTPLDDCKGIGYMMGKLNKAINRGIPL